MNDNNEGGYEPLTEKEYVVMKKLNVQPWHALTDA